MIKFFRKIRQKLLSENKFSKYLIYAIGEIILVVIGILIALQINNWNENQKNNEKEISIAKELYIELNENQISVKNQLELWENRDKKISEVISLIESENVKLTNREFDSTLIYVIAFSNFKLKQSKFQRILSLESFQFKKSPTLINDMLSLNNMYTTLMDYYRQNDDNYHKLLQPYLIENYATENFNNIITGRKTESKVDYHQLLYDLKFANIIHSSRGSSAPFVQRIKITINRIEALKRQLEKFYPSIIIANNR
ncbi:DUF6090 family protein [Litoribaculum gwangyangense]|uniref:Uncharacterized protein n=1 Tax=Litoribaculum gwangyangense TaxID=1130722 RepID=A0ABP9CXP4_9FLAO